MVDNNSSPKIVVLVYHRIIVAETDPWGLCVSPENFEQHLQILKSEFNIVNAEELLQQVSAKKIMQNSVCITFDDGYADNFINAKILLEKYNCPATFFITTASIGRQKQFWWDELGNIFLQTNHLPAFLSFETGSGIFEHHIIEQQLTTKMRSLHRKWKYHQNPPTGRCVLYLKIWEWLLPLPFEEINAVMDTLKNWVSADLLYDSRNFAMNCFQIKKLQGNPLFSIGMHTITHPDLTTKKRLAQKKEIYGSKLTLNHQYGIKTKMLAYPYGRYNQVTIDVARSLKIAACFTTDQKVVHAQSDLKTLGRFQVFDWKGKVFREQLNSWML